MWWRSKSPAWASSATRLSRGSKGRERSIPVKRTMLIIIALGLTLLAADRPVHAEEIVVQAPYVTVRVGAGGPGGVIVDLPFVRISVPPKGMKGQRAPRGIETLPPPLPSSSGAEDKGGANGEERIPPRMLPPPV